MGTVPRPLSDTTLYDPDAWAAGPEPVYDRLSVEIVDASPVSMRGLRVLDVGAGTGAASRALRAAGARPLALDVSARMLDRIRTAGIERVVADASRLPLRDGAADAAVAAFVLAHLDDPVEGLREVSRVVRDGGVVLAAQFDGTSAHPAKAAVERVAERAGFRRPAWYESLKSAGEARLGTAERFASVARLAGLRDPCVVCRRVDVGVRTAQELVRWRLGIPSFAAFYRSLDGAARRRFIHEAVRAVGDQPEPLQLAVLVLAARTRRAGE